MDELGFSGAATTASISKSQSGAASFGTGVSVIAGACVPSHF
jgi:hypothetical protein